MTCFIPGHRVDDTATDLDEGVGVVGVPDGDGHSLVSLDVLEFPGVDLVVDDDVLVITSHPHDVCLGLTVGKNRCERRKVGAFGEGPDLVVQHDAIVPQPPCRAG